MTHADAAIPHLTMQPASAVVLWAGQSEDLANLRVDPAGHKFGQAAVVLKSIRDAAAVRDLVARQANAARTAAYQRQHDLELERRRAAVAAPVMLAPAAAAPAPAGDDLLAKLEKLAAMRDAGILDADEFAAAKQKLLS